ncbi:MAG: glycoside hydrolase 43 family protein [Opitutales bacterium]|nr:glycoside hydrolase 43 family protein [Opitutales bacterium]
MKYKKTLLLLSALCSITPMGMAVECATNPTIYADMPDASIVRVGDFYYMSSTTMHMAPGVPIMKSNDLVNWKIVSYAYDTLADTDELNLLNGKNDYARGSWASSLRYHDGVFYVSTFSNSTGKTHVYSTSDPERDPWKAIVFSPKLYDNSLFFDDDGRVYMINGHGIIKITELLPDLSGVKPGGVDQVIVENANALFEEDLIGLPAEGSQLFKINGKYYLFNIASPGSHWSRTVFVHRADKITGPYEGRIAFQDRGIAQGGLVETPSGDWYAYLFQDTGAVGRLPWLVPVTWENGWPVIGQGGTAPQALPKLPANKSLIPDIVNSDEFNYVQETSSLPLVWQWNHNPQDSYWSLSARPGYLRLTTDRVDTDFLTTHNTLTQRTFGPVCSGTTLLDTAQMQEGDFAGLGLLQKLYGLIGVKIEHGQPVLLMVNAQEEIPVDVERVPLPGNKVYLKVECDFRDLVDTAHFFYSLDGDQWKPFGDTLQMQYTMPHFMGYRFALFNYATLTPGGSADFDFFHISEHITK